jgi:hypothetical protein
MENEIDIFSYHIQRLSKFEITHMYNKRTIKVKLALLPVIYHAIKIYVGLSHIPSFLLKSTLDEANNSRYVHFSPEKRAEITPYKPDWTPSTSG